MGAETDPLDDWLSDFRRPSRDETDNRPARKTPPPSKDRRRGLEALDILALPEEQRELVAWLSRERTATAAEIAAGLEKDEAEIRSLLQELLDAGHVNMENEEAGRYRVRFGSRRHPNLPSDIWRKAGLDDGGEESSAASS